MELITVDGHKGLSYKTSEALPTSYPITLTAKGRNNYKILTAKASRKDGI